MPKPKSKELEKMEAQIEEPRGEERPISSHTATRDDDGSKRSEEIHDMLNEVLEN